jgi:hypothetical protein
MKNMVGKIGDRCKCGGKKGVEREKNINNNNNLRTLYEEE